MKRSIRATEGIEARQAAAALAAMLLMLLPAVGHAATVALSGSGAMASSFQFLGQNGATPTVGSDYTLGVDGQYTFTDTFTTQQTVALGVSSVGSYDFQDSYRFTVASGANGNVLTTQLGLPPTFDITNLQLRLYDVTAATSMTPVAGGVPAGSVFLTPWIGVGAGATSVFATFSNIQANHTYVLDIAGIASGVSGGTYFGQVNLVSTPLPAAAWLLLSAVLGFGMLPRRWRVGG
jgi:hypothetical protein